jgi:hypothetical protein
MANAAIDVSTGVDIFGTPEEVLAFTGAEQSVTVTPPSGGHPGFRVQLTSSVAWRLARTAGDIAANRYADIPAGAVVTLTFRGNTAVAFYVYAASGNLTFLVLHGL